MKKLITMLMLLIVISGCSQPKSRNKPIAIEPIAFETEFNSHINIESDLIKVGSVELDLRGNDLHDIADQVVQYVTLNLDSEDSRKISNKINIDADNYLQELVFHPNDELYQGHWKSVSFFKINYWINDDILSIVTQNKRYLYEAASGYPENNTYNIDLKDGHLLTNLEIVESMSLSPDDVSAIISEYLTTANIKSCAETTDSALPCHVSDVFDNESLLYIDGEKIWLLLKLTQGIEQLHVSIPLVYNL